MAEDYTKLTNEELAAKWKAADEIVETTVSQLQDLGLEKETVADMVHTFSKEYPGSVKKHLFRYLPAFQQYGMDETAAEEYLNIISQNCRIRTKIWEELFTRNKTFFITMIRRYEASGFKSSSEVIESALHNLAADFPHLLRLYDPSQGTLFCTYIGKAIRQPYRAAVRELSPGNSTTIHEENQLVKYHRAIAELEAEGKPYDMLAICQKAGFGMKALNNVIRLDEQRKKTGHYQGATFGKDQNKRDMDPSTGVSLEDDYFKKEQTALVHKAVDNARKRINLPLPTSTIIQLLNGDISLTEGHRMSGLTNYRLQDMLNSIWKILQNNRIMRELANADDTPVRVCDNLEDAVEDIRLEFVSDTGLVQQYLEDVSSAIAIEQSVSVGEDDQPEDLIF